MSVGINMPNKGGGSGLSSIMSLYNMFDKSSSPSSSSSSLGSKYGPDSSAMNQSAAPGVTAADLSTPSGPMNGFTGDDPQMDQLNAMNRRQAAMIAPANRGGGKGSMLTNLISLV